MSRQRVSSALAIWRSRVPRSPRSSAFVAYASLLLGITVGAPLAHVLWLGATSPDGLALLASTTTSPAVAVVTAGLWAAAVVMGRIRGPVLMPSFPLFALATSGIRRSTALRGPLLRAGMSSVMVLVGGAGFVGASVLHGAPVHLPGAIGFFAVTIAIGVIATVLWLVGQVFPRAAIPLALGILVAAGVGSALPSVSLFFPWGWAGESLHEPAMPTLPGAGILILALLLAASTPLLLNRLSGASLIAQAVKWEQATMFSIAFSFDAATAVYTPGPHLGRRLHAVRPRRVRALTFFLRDAIGLLRTPGRLLAGIGAAAVAGVLITLSIHPALPSALLAGAAGLMTHGAAGPLARGVGHAAKAAGDVPLYGLRDEALVFLHALFPLVTLAVLIPVAAAATGLVTGVHLGAALALALPMALIGLAIRLAGALKGPLPTGLLTPVPTPVGDLSILLRLGWACGELILSVLGGLGVAMLPRTPLPLLALATGVAALVVVRWTNRR